MFKVCVFLFIELQIWTQTIDQVRKAHIRVQTRLIVFRTYYLTYVSFSYFHFYSFHTRHSLQVSLQKLLDPTLQLFDFIYYPRETQSVVWRKTKRKINKMPLIFLKPFKKVLITPINCSTSPSISPQIPKLPPRFGQTPRDGFKSDVDQIQLYPYLIQIQKFEPKSNLIPKDYIHFIYPIYIRSESAKPVSESNPID